MNKRIGLVIAGAATAAVMAGGTAFGAVSSSQSIPASGPFTACYQANGAGATNGTPLYIIDPNQASCGKNQTSITWNQNGPAGPQGPPGATGPAGPGYTFTLTLGGVPGSPGPQLTNGTYFVDAEVEFYNHDAADPLIGNCPILGQRSDGTADSGFYGTFMLPPNGQRDMSFTGLITVSGASSTSPETLVVGPCENTAAGILSAQPVVQVVWAVAPVARSN